MLDAAFHESPAVFCLSEHKIVSRNVVLFSSPFFEPTIRLGSTQQLGHILTSVTSRSFNVHTSLCALSTGLELPYTRGFCVWQRSGAVCTYEAHRQWFWINPCTSYMELIDYSTQVSYRSRYFFLWIHRTIEELKYFNFESLLENTKLLKSIFPDFRVDEKIPSVCNLFTNKQHCTTIKTYSLSVWGNDTLLCMVYSCDLFFWSSIIK